MECTITVTESAREKVNELLEGAPDMSAIRVYVSGGGCSGMQHSMTFDRFISSLQSNKMKLVFHKS